MNQWAETINAGILIGGAIICLIGSVALNSRYFLEASTIRYFRATLLALSVYIIVNGAGLLLLGMPGLLWRIVTHMTVFLEFLMGYLMIFLASQYLLESIEGLRYKKWFARGLDAVFALQTGLLLASQVTGLFYYFTEENQYVRNPGTYWLSSVFSVAVIVFDVIVLISHLGKLSRNLQIAFLIYAMLPAAGLILQFWLPNLNVPLGAAVFGELAMLVYVLGDQREKYYIQLQENNRMRTALMLSQIQPHFLYNSLGAIRELCRIDPERAEAATVQFSQYLRHNMDSLQQMGTVPFTEELNHVRNYLELEKLRFGDAIRVEYKIRVKKFRLPSLTLQPIVENAIRHGIRKNEEGGTVYIETREDEDYYYVDVIDNGVGFVPGNMYSDGRTHVGLKNVSSRLLQICGGDVSISSKPMPDPDHGTRVTMRVPKETFSSSAGERRLRPTRFSGTGITINGKQE